MESRHTDHTPLQCNDCGWQGLVLECIHPYEGNPLDGDVESVDLCPECRGDNLIEILPDYSELVPA